MKQLANYETQNILSRRAPQGRLRRAVALMSAVVMFFTMNSLKMQADTLERVATCGQIQHLHDESCYDRSGGLTCGLEEHLHTDACYQQRPERHSIGRLDQFVQLNSRVNLSSPLTLTSSAADEYEVVEPAVDVYSDILPGAEEQTEVGFEEALTDDIEGPVDEITMELGGDEAEVQADDGLEIVYEETAPTVYEYDLDGASEAAVADVLAANGLPAEYIAAGELVDDAFDAVDFAVEDGAIKVLKDFDVAELGVDADTEIYTVYLRNGKAPAEEPTEVGENQTEVGIHDETEITENNSENDENISENELQQTDDETEIINEDAEEKSELDSEAEEEIKAEDGENIEEEDAEEEIEVEETVEASYVTEAAQGVTRLDFTDYVATGHNATYLYDNERGAVMVLVNEIGDADGVRVSLPETVLAAEAMEAELGVVEEAGETLEAAPIEVELALADGPVTLENDTLLITGNGTLTAAGATYEVVGLELPASVLEGEDITVTTVNGDASLLGVVPVFEPTDNDYTAIFDMIAAEMGSDIVVEEAQEQTVTLAAQDAGALEVPGRLMRARALSAADAVETVEDAADAPAATEHKTLQLKLFDIALRAENGDVEPASAIHVETTFDPIEGEGFELYHIVDKTPVRIPDAVRYDASGRAVGLSFDTTSLSPFGVAYYTVAYTTTDNVIEVKVDFTDIVQNGVDFDANDVITALNDGVGVSIDELEKGYEQGTDAVLYGELYIDYTTADNKNENVANVKGNWRNYDVAEISDGLSVVDGEIRVTADGRVVLSDGTDTITIIITNYSRLLAKALSATGVDIEVIDGSVPAGSEVSYTALDDAKANELVSTYNIEETATKASIVDQNILDSTTGYTAFDVTIKRPEGDDFTDAGVFAVAVDHPVDVTALIPEGAKVVGVDYTLYHIHDGEAQPVQDATVADGRVLFTTDSFSEYVLIYTIDFTLDGYTFSYPGKIPFLLSDLLAALHIDVDAADVVDIQFTNNDLFRVEHVEGDWEIEGVESFTTEEGMILTLADGEKIYIFATDPAIDATIDLNDVDGSGKSKDVTSFTASVSKAVQNTEQGRDSSFKMNFAFELTDEGFAKLQAGASSGFPTIVYDMNSYINDPDVPIESIQNMSTPVYDGDKKIGQVRIEDGVAIMTITNLDWLASQTRFDADFDLVVNTSANKLGTQDYYEFDFPGTTEDFTIKYKKISFDTTKTVNYTGRQENGDVVLTEDADGNYLLHYTVRLHNPTQLDNLTFADTMTGNQYLFGDVTVSGVGKTVTVPGQSGKNISFDVRQQLGLYNVPAGDYTVTYTTKIDKASLKTIGEDGATEEKNSAKWTINGSRTEEPDPVVIKPHKDRPPMTVEKKVNGNTGTNQTGWSYGSELNYTIEYGNSEKPMGGVTINDQMTDNQKLVGSITVKYKDGSTETIPADALATDTNYSVNRVNLFSFKLKDDAGYGPVTVTYQTKIISKEEAAEAGIYGIQSVLNNANSEGVSSETEGKVTFPEKPVQTKTATSSQALVNGRWQLGDTITYTLTYGSLDIPLAKTHIQDTMTKLQNLDPRTISITYADGSTGNLNSAITWTNLSNASDFSTESAQVFDYTFPEGETRVGPVTITYTTKLITLDQVKELNISGAQNVTNTFTVNDNPVYYTGSIPTNTPNTVTKSVVNETHPNATNWAPGDVLEYTIELNGDRLVGSTVTDTATDIQKLISDIEIYANNNSETPIVTISKNDADHIGADFLDAEYSTDSKELFHYKLENITITDEMKPLKVVYKMQIIDANTANNDMHLYGLQGTNNNATTDRGGNGGTGKNTDFGEKPVIPKDKEVHASEHDPDVRNSKDGWQPEEVLNYTLTFGDGNTKMAGYTISDRMTNLQHLIVPDDPEGNTGITVTYTDTNGTPKTIYMDSSAITSYGENDWSTNLVQLFNYTMPSDAGYGEVTVSYSTKVISLAKATELGIYDLQKIENRFTFDGETVTTWGDVPFKDDPKPKKKVEHAETVADPDSYLPGQTVTYTATFGDETMELNGAVITDKMTNVQTLDGPVVVSYYDESGEQHSFNMPTSTDAAVANPGGVCWPLTHTPNKYFYDQWNPTNGMQMVFNYQLPASGDTVDGVAIGTIKGPVTVTYNAILMTQDQATANGIYVDVQAKNIFEYNQQPAMTSIDVPYEDQAKHEPQLKKTGFVNAKGEPIWPEFEGGQQKQHTPSGTAYPVYDEPEGAHANLDMATGTVTWIMEISKTGDSTYPLSDVYFVENMEASTAKIANGTVKFSELMASGRVKAVEAEIRTASGTVLTPGTDYNVFFGGDNPWDTAPENRATTYTGQKNLVYYFPTINEPVYVKLNVEFYDSIVGSYSMNNYAYVKQTDGYYNAEAHIGGYNTEIIVDKNGAQDDDDHRYVEWTVDINKEYRTLDPDWDEVLFSDIVPDHMIVVNAEDKTDHEHPSINVILNGRGQNGKTIEYPVTVKDGKIQPVDIHLQIYDTNTGTLMYDYGLSELWYRVKYYTYVDDEAWDALTSSASGSMTFSNTAIFSDGDTQIKSDTGDVTIEEDDFVDKKDVSQGTVKEVGGQNVLELSGNVLSYLIEVNPNGYNMNNGQPLMLSDTIPTSMNLNAPSIRVFKVTEAAEQAMENAGITELTRDNMYDEVTGELILAYMGEDITNTVSTTYNDDTRVLSIEGIPDNQHYRVFFTAGMRSIGGTDVETFSNTVTLFGAGSYSDEVEEKHTSADLSAHAHGGMKMCKLDENNIKKGLEGAVFELYRVYTTPVVVDPQMSGDTVTGYTVTADGDKVYRVEQITVGADENGQYTSDKNGDVKFGTFEFSPDTLYYWVERQAPEGYVGDLDVPHYFVLYDVVTSSEESELGQGKKTTQENMLRAWALDTFWQDEYGITVASYPNDANWYATNSQYRSITATKKWEGDSNNLYKKRPTDGVKLTLIRINADGSRTTLDSRVIKGDNSDTWPSYTWNKLDVYDEDGNEYRYTVEEEPVLDYYAEYSDDGDGITSGEIVIVNRPTPGKTSIEVEKVWKIGDNVPSTIQVQLVQIYTDADNNSFEVDDEDFEGKPAGMNTIVDLMPDQSGRWTYTWNNLPTKDSKGGHYSYTVKELTQQAPDILVKYSDDSTGIVKGKITITNYKPGALVIKKKVTVNGQETTGTLADGDYNFNIIDESGKIVKTATITVTNGVSEELKVSDLQPGEYTVREVMPNNGTAIAAGTPKEYNLTVVAGLVDGVEVPVASFTNNKDTTRLTVKKQWLTNSSEWPENAEATIRLMEVNAATGETTQVTGRDDATVVLTEEQQTYTWTNLDASKTYTVTEDPLADFVTEVSDIDSKQTITVTNKEVKDVPYKKVWDGTAPETWRAEIELVKRERVIVAYGEPVKNPLDFEGDYVDAGYEHVFVSNSNVYTFENLPKYRHDGNTVYEIDYSVREVSVFDGTTDVTNQYTGVVTDDAGTKVITNTPSTQVPVKKIWADGKPKNVASVEFTLYDGAAIATHVDNETQVAPVTLPIIDAAGNEVWEYTFKDLPRGRDYSIKETKVTFTNGKVLSGADKIATVFGATTGEETVEGTTVKTITNDREAIDIPVYKTWKDIDSSRVQNVNFTLYIVTTKADGTEKEQKVSTDADGNSIAHTFSNVHAESDPEKAEKNWRRVWENLPKYDENGELIKYRIRETRVQANGTTYNGEAAVQANWGDQTWKDVTEGKETEIINTPVTVELSVSKRWSLQPSEDAKVTIALLRDGQPATETGDVVKDGDTAFNFVLPTQAGKWFDTKTGLPKYDNTGRLITWSIKETKITYTDDQSREVTLYDVLPDGVTASETVNTIESKYTVNGEGEFVFAEGSDSAAKAISNNLPQKPTGETMQITLNKVWGDGTAVPENASATFTLHQQRLALPEENNRRTVIIYASNKRTELARGILDVTVNDATLTFSGVNDNLSAVFKYVKNDQQVGNNTTASGKNYAGTVSIDWTQINDDEVLELYVNKKATDFDQLPYLYNDGTWGVSEDTHEWTITLSTNAEESHANFGPWGYIWDYLPKTDTEAGYRYRYWITEDSSTPDWFVGLFDVGGSVATALTDSDEVNVTNKEGLSVTKKWTDVYDVEKTPTTTTIYFKLLADDTSGNSKGIEYRDSNVSGWDSSKNLYKIEYANGVWSTVKFGLLPATFAPWNWYGNTMNVGQYYVVETDESGNTIGSSASYVASYDLNGTQLSGTTGFGSDASGTVTITNKDKPDKTKIYVKKVWDGVDAEDQKPVTVELWAKEVSSEGDATSQGESIDVEFSAKGQNGSDLTAFMVPESLRTVKSGTVFNIKWHSIYNAQNVIVQYSDNGSDWTNYQTIQGIIIGYDSNLLDSSDVWSEATVVVPKHPYLRLFSISDDLGASWVRWNISTKQKVVLDTESRIGESITIDYPSWEGSFDNVEETDDYVYYIKETLIDGQAVSGMTISYEYVDANGVRHCGTNKDEDEMSGGVAAGGAVTVTNSKEEESKGKIIVSKTWDGVTDNTDLAALQAGFTLTVNGTDAGGSGVDTKTYSYSQLPATIENLPLNATYSITERNTATDTLAKYTVVSASTVDSFAGVEPTVEGVTKTLVNTYAPKTGTVDFTQVKTFTNGTASTAFGYTITEYTDNQYSTVKGSPITGSMSQSTSGVTTISYTLADLGSHYYIVKENLPNGTTVTAADEANGYIIVDGIKYDLTEHRYTVEVSASASENTLVVKKDSMAVTNIDSSFTNEQLGSLEITKAITVGGSEVAEPSEPLIQTVQGPYTFTITKDGDSSFTKTVTITVTDGKSNTALVENLSQGTYTINETTPTNGTALTNGNDKSVTVTAGKRASAELENGAKAGFTNNLPTTSVSVNKTWLTGSVNYSTALEDMFGTVTVEVGVFDVVSTADADTLAALTAADVAKNVFGNDAKADLTASTWSATISNLPELASGHKYYVKELSVKNGKNQDLSSYFTKSGEAMVDGNGSVTINNELETIDVTVSKDWVPEIPENASATLSLYKGKTEETATTKVTDITLNGAAGEAEQIDSSDAKAGTKRKTGAWAATFSNLPMYAYDANDGVYTIVYVIKEDSVPEGYSVSYSGGNAYAVSSGTVTNTKNPGDLELTKRVSGTGASTVIAFNFTIELTAPTGGTLAESYKYTKTGEDGEQTLTLTRTDSNTEASITGIELKADEVYTIKGLPAGTTYKITEQDYTNDDYSSSIPEGGLIGTIEGGTTAETAVEVTNTYGPKGSLKLKKIVKVNQENMTTTLADGQYLFDVTSIGITPAVEKVVEITVINGAAATYKVIEKQVDAETEATMLGSASETAVGSDGFAEVINLPVGTYTITERVGANGTTLLSAVRGDDDTTAVNNNVVTVEVKANKTGDTVEDSGKATFTNNKVGQYLRVQKRWQTDGTTWNPNYSVPTLYYKIYKVDDGTKTLVTDAQHQDGLRTLTVDDTIKVSADDAADVSNIIEDAITANVSGFAATGEAGSRTSYTIPYADVIGPVEQGIYEFVECTTDDNHTELRATTTASVQNAKDQFWTCPELNGTVTAIKNNLETVTARKEWRDEGNADLVHPAVTFKLYRTEIDIAAEETNETLAAKILAAKNLDGNPTAADVSNTEKYTYMGDDSDTRYADKTIPAGTENNQQVSWTDLPCFDLSTGKRYVYVVVEQTEGITGYTYDGVSVNDTLWTFFNKLDTVEEQANKSWIKAPGTEITLTPDAGTTVEFTLYKKLKGSSNEPVAVSTIVLNGKKDIDPEWGTRETDRYSLKADEEWWGDGTGGSGNTANAHEDGLWQANWYKLPKYQTALTDGTLTVTEWEYSVVETAIEVNGTDASSQWATQVGTSTTTEGKTTVTITNMPVTSVGGRKIWQTTITLRSNPTLKLTRTWQGNTGDPEVLMAYKETNTVYGSATGNASDDMYLQPDWSTGSGNVKTYTYANLPKYNSEGLEYQYTVTEVSFALHTGGGGLVTYNIEGDDVVKEAIPQGVTEANYAALPEFVYRETPNDATNGMDFFNGEETVKTVSKRWDVYGVKDEDLSDPDKASDDKIQSITYRLNRGFQFFPEDSESDGSTGTETAAVTYESYKTVTLEKRDDGRIYVTNATQPYASQDWSYSWDNLEKYGYQRKAGSQGSGTDIGEAGYNGEYLYTVEEIGFTYNGVPYTVEGTTVKKVTEESGQKIYTDTDTWLVSFDETTRTYTNTLNETPFEFTKQWRDGSSTSNKNWPTENDTELAITVKLQRRLKKNPNNIAAGYVIDPDFTETFSIAPSSHSGWDMQIVYTAKADPNDANNNTEPVYTFSKTGLKKHGTITIAEGEDKGIYTGDFEYFMTETSLNGYNTTYLTAINGTPTGTKEDITTGEVIRNTVEMSFELPSTGGPGTTGFYVLGSILTLLAVVLLVTKKRTDGQGIE